MEKTIDEKIDEIEKRFDEKFVIGDNGDLFEIDKNGRPHGIDPDSIKAFYRGEIDKITNNGFIPSKF